MPDFSAINSWPAAVVALVLLISLQVPGLVSTIRTHRDTKVIREHTENEHDEADYPNLRDELTATRVAAEQAATAAKEAVAIASASDARLTSHVEQADSWQTSVEEEMSRLRRPLLAWRR